MTNYNNADTLKKQYETDRNLNSRILLHQLYSTNKTGWNNWVYKNYKLYSGLRILELGCGNAGIWRHNADKIPAGVKFVLSDFSPGMLEAAKKNAGGAGVDAEYAVIDAQDIPYEDGAFGAVIANHILYHVPDIHKALNEISRVIKPGGVFYATTIGRGNMAEITDILHGFNVEINFATETITQTFNLENGKEILFNYFYSVNLLKYEDGLHITAAEPLIDYVLSSAGLGNADEIITGDEIARFRKYIVDIIKANGCIDITKNAGMFISKKKPERSCE